MMLEITRGGRLGQAGSPEGQTGSPEGAGRVTRGGRLGHPRGQAGSPEGQTGSPEGAGWVTRGADWVTRGGRLGHPRGQKSCIHAYVCMHVPLLRVVWLDPHSNGVILVAGIELLGGAAYGQTAWNHNM